MLYDDNAINQAYDLLKKANTYLQIASDYCGYNNVCAYSFKAFARWR